MGTGTGNSRRTRGMKFPAIRASSRRRRRARVRSGRGGRRVERSRRRSVRSARRCLSARARRRGGRASFEGARRVFSRRLRQRGGCPRTPRRRVVHAGTDASLTFDVSRVSDATEDPRVGKGVDVVLPDDSRRAPTERGGGEASRTRRQRRGRLFRGKSSAGESSAEESSAGDAAPTARPDGDSGANVSNVSNVASDDEESESGTFFGGAGGPSAWRRVADFRVGTRDAVVLVRRPGDGRGGGGGVAIRGEIGEIGARSPTPRRSETRGGARRRRRGRALCRGWASSRRRSRPAPRDSHRGSFEEHARGGAPADEETTRAERAAAAAGFPRNGLVDAPELPSRVVPLDDV